MRNKILSISLTAIFMMTSLSYAQKEECSAIDYDALSSINNGMFEAQGWLQKANEYAKQTSDAHALNQSLYLYMNLLQDSSVDPEILVSAYQGMNHLLETEGSSLDMSCVIGKGLGLARIYLNANEMDTLEIKPDPKIVAEAKRYPEVFAKAQVPENASLDNLMVLANWENVIAAERLQQMEQDASIPYRKLLKAKLTVEEIQTLLNEYPQALKTFTDKELVDFYQLIKFFEYHPNEEIQVTSKEISQGILVNNPQIEEFQLALNLYSNKDLNGLELIRPIVNESSSVLSQLVLADLLYSADDYQESYQIIKNLADQGDRAALAMMVRQLFMYKSKIPLKQQEIMAWINRADALYQKTHDPILVKALYGAYDYDTVPEKDFHKYLAYAETGLFTEYAYYLENRQQVYQDLQELLRRENHIQTLIAQGDKAALMALWKQDGYDYIFSTPSMLEKMSDIGVSQAQYRFALQHEKEGHDAKAFSYFLKAADNGNENAKFAVAYAYMMGKGIEKDREKAIHYFNFAHKDNNSDSGYGDYDKEKLLYGTIYQWMKEKPNEEAIMNLDKKKYLLQSIHLDKDAPMFFIMEDVENL